MNFTIATFGIHPDEASAWDVIPPCTDGIQTIGDGETEAEAFEDAVEQLHFIHRLDPDTIPGFPRYYGSDDETICTSCESCGTMRECDNCTRSFYVAVTVRG